MTRALHLVGLDQVHGFERRLATDIYPADFGWTPDHLDLREVEAGGRLRRLRAQVIR